jgi:penicillin-binding protein 1A
MSIGAMILMTLVTAGMTLVFLVWIGMFGNIPGKKALKEIQNPLASEVYSADSVLLGRYFFQERSPVSEDEIPETLKNALIATEDVRFFDHDGIDYRSLFRVLFKSILLQDEGSGGGSTITQQLAKNLYPRKTYGALTMPVNKIKEFILARRMERIYTKEQILTLYLNTIPFADNTYGIKTAADRFFATKVKNLSVHQSAVLVGMLKATHYYNPRLFPERSLQRRNIVISQMAKYEFISPAEEAQQKALPLGLKLNRTTHDNEGAAPYFRAHIRRELLEWCKENKRPDGQPYNLYTDGLKIYTTIDSRLQKYAEEAMKAHMRNLQVKFKNQLSKQQVESVAKSSIAALPIYKRLKASGLSDNEVIKKLKQPVKMKIFSWDGYKDVTMSVYDSLKHHLQFLQVGVLALEPRTGDIKVWIGGIDHTYFKFDHVRESTKRQVGSTIKPILYAAALERGISPCTYISARKTSYTNMEDWTPQNTDDATYDLKYSMEGGLANSVNTVSVKLLEKTGINNAIAIARKMGIQSSLQAVPSLALGAPSISVTEMVAAYSVFANQGIYIEPQYLSSITDQKGKVLEQFTPTQKPTRALSKETTQLMVQMLGSVVSEGTGASLRTRYGLTNDIVGKTGTTQSNVDGWFIAVMPELVIGTWVGADDPRMHFKTTAQGQGAATALPIVAGMVQRSNKDKTLRKVMNAKFPPLSANLLDELDCDRSKSDRNFFQRLFKKKKGTKITKFKSRKDKHSEP